MGFRHSRRSDFDALVQRYTGAQLPRGHGKSDDEDENEHSRRRRHLMQICQPAVRRVEEAMRALPENHPLDHLFSSLTKSCA
ncbi:MAG: hypothetical protein M0P72_01240 [Metallibacterium scheffleri]|jgi:hypothetical protein|uniref:hypothetical protein n=1 Tax=Metallibacterium scheffleri TaxID=993689 RepID=UPI0026F0E31C|nr:hypothetical protein [Metallibacterium scheffleri]MCK9365763.1 hypothetical protein [Metallibacterium scheffleri]